MVLLEKVEVYVLKKIAITQTSNWKLDEDLSGLGLQTDTNEAELAELRKYVANFVEPTPGEGPMLFFKVMDSREGPTADRGWLISARAGLYSIGDAG
jgi:hypothetical protein